MINIEHSQSVWAGNFEQTAAVCSAVCGACNRPIANRSGRCDTYKRN